MQLKLVRSQKTSGMMSKSVVFCLDAHVDLTEEERHLVEKYKLGSTVLYNSEASRKHLAAASAAAETVGGVVGSFARLAMAKLSLNISIDSLCRGQHVEAKDLDELLGAEEAVKLGCEHLRTYLDVASTFDGREVVIKYDGQSEAAAA